MHFRTPTLLLSSLLIGFTLIDNVNSQTSVNVTFDPNLQPPPRADNPNIRGPTIEIKEDDMARFFLSDKWKITDKPKVRVFDWEVSWRNASLDGFEKPVIAINGMVPGPILEANEGDTIVVNVQNNLNIATTIHWHGLLQNGTVYEDGVPGITQCPIPPHSNYTYNFNLTSFGTFWYHAHTSTQYADGHSGPFIVHSKRDPLVRGRDFDQEVVIYWSEVFHDLASNITAGLLSVDGYRGSNAPPLPDATMINGHGKYNCSYAPEGSVCKERSHPTLDLEPNTKYRFRVINAGAHAAIRFSIDDHHLQLVELDSIGVYDPTTNRTFIPVHSAQRSSFTFKTGDCEGDKGLFWARAEQSNFCLNGGGAYPPEYDPDPRIIMRCQPKKKKNHWSSHWKKHSSPSASTNSTKLPTTSAWDPPAGQNFTTMDCVDVDNNTTDIHPLLVDQPPQPSQIHSFTSFAGALVYQGVSHARFLFRNDSSLPVAYVTHPYRSILETLVGGGRVNSSNIASITIPDDEWTTDIIINNLDPQVGLTHPYHLHGNDFWVMARGEGNLTTEQWASADFRSDNPVRRDTVVTSGGHYTVIRIKSDNPGAWAFHCHIAFHLVLGFMALLVVSPEKIKSMKIPQDNLDLCTANLALPGVDIEDQEPARRGLLDLDIHESRALWERISRETF